MTSKTVCLLVSGLIVMTLLVTSCTPRVTEEEGALPEEAASPAVVDTEGILIELCEV